MSDFKMVANGATYTAASHAAEKQARPGAQAALQVVSGTLATIAATPGVDPRVRAGAMITSGVMQAGLTARSDVKAANETKYAQGPVRGTGAQAASFNPQPAPN